LPSCTPEWGEEGTLTAAGEDQKLKDRDVLINIFLGIAPESCQYHMGEWLKLIEDLVTEYGYNLWWSLGELTTLGWYVCDIREGSGRKLVVTDIRHTRMHTYRDTHVPHILTYSA